MSSPCAQRPAESLAAAGAQSLFVGMDPLPRPCLPGKSRQGRALNRWRRPPAPGGGTGGSQGALSWSQPCPHPTLLGPAGGSRCCGKAGAGWRARPQAGPQRASGRSLVHTWKRPGGPCGGCSRQVPRARAQLARWGEGVWALALAAAGSAGSRPAACGSESERGVRNPGQHRRLREHAPSPPSRAQEPILTSLCSLRSSSLRLLLTFMSCCTLASEAARAFFSSRYSCSVTAPSDRSEESMLCRGRRAGQPPCRRWGPRTGGWGVGAALGPALGCSAWRRRCAGAPGLCPRPRPRCRSRAGRPGRSGPARTARGCLRAQACHSAPGPEARAPPAGSVPWSGAAPFPPVGLPRLLPCCLRLASLRMSMIKVANSRALKRASFCRPWEGGRAGLV